MNRSARPGFTAIELLVVLSLLSLLIALLLPAIQSSREAGRRAVCQDHLRQIGLAIHSYLASSNCFPISVTSARPDVAGASPYFGLYSAQCRMLPYLEQGPLYQAINFQTGTWPPDTFFAGSTNALTGLNLANSTVFGTGLGLFLCPSDGGAFEDTGNNYRGNTGVGPAFSRWAESPDSGNGLFPEVETIDPSRVVDGLSHTVAFSERIRGSGIQSGSPDPRRDVLRRQGVANTADELLNECRIAARPSNQDRYVWSGRYWFWAGRERTLYTHSQTPNGPIPDCTYGGMTPAIDMATARSYHPGGVNSLMGDGSGRFVSESIVLPVWRALGTRDGGEIVD